jgi:flagellar biosynthesis protein FlhG
MTNIWPIGGGKGGSGKSFLAGNLGICLARQGNKTLLIDADFGAANLHTMIGMPYHEKSLSDFLNKKVPTLEETVIETRIPNLFLISGAGNNLDTANMAYLQKKKVFRAISKLPYDFILLDLGAGTSFNTIDFFLLSDSGIFVTTPEPTSIENVYRLIRAVYARKIRQLLKVYDFEKLVEAADAELKGVMINNPEYLLSIIKKLDQVKGQMVNDALGRLHFKLVLNQLRKQDNPKTGVLICRIIEKHLGFSVRFVGNIAYDERVHDAVCQKAVFLDKYSFLQTAGDLKKFAAEILATKKENHETSPAVEALEETAELDRNFGGMESHEAIGRAQSL